MMQTDVKSATITATGSLIAARSRLRGISYRGDGTAGSITFTNGSGGATNLVLNTGTSDTFTIYIEVPGEGILFENSMYATLVHISSLTVFYA